MCIRDKFLVPLLAKLLPLPKIYLYSLAGYAVAGLLDACTSYGTHLWLPFSGRKEAWNLIAVFDPLFTLLLLVPLALALRRPQRHWTPVGPVSYTHLDVYKRQHRSAR